MIQMLLRLHRRIYTWPDPLTAHNTGNSSCQGCLTMVNVTDRSDIHVRFGRSNFSFDMETSQYMVDCCKILLFQINVTFIYQLISKKPTTGIEPMNLILTKDVLYQLSYMGTYQKAGNETRTHNNHLGRVELYQLSYARIYYLMGRDGFEPP